MQQVEDKLLISLSFFLSFLSVDKTISLLISVLTTNHFVYIVFTLKQVYYYSTSFHASLFERSVFDILFVIAAI